MPTLVELEQCIKSMPELCPDILDFSSGILRIGSAAQLSNADKQCLQDALLFLGPWRKGPVSFFGIDIDSEWRSDLKWDRLAAFGEQLFKGKQVLDIGCNNGYYMFRMLPYGPQAVLGIDPIPVFEFQFNAVQRYAKAKELRFLRRGLADLQHINEDFDTVLSMGVLYHRKDSIQALKQMIAPLRAHGQLLLETLIIPGDAATLLRPKEGRYAGMPNVYELPTESLLIQWLQDLGLGTIQVLDRTWTNSMEQRVTDWSRSRSLSDFLNDEDNSMTVEGYAAPYRIMILASL